MKKLTFFILMLAMIMSLSSTALATTISTGDHDIDVEAIYQDNITMTTVYSVDVSWDAMQFTYTESGELIWDPVNHTYIDSTTGEWSAYGNTVTVTNHSNAEVTAYFDFYALDEYNSVTGSFDIPYAYLAAGELNGYDSADSVVATLTLDGALDADVVEFTKVGTITVTIA